MDENVINVIQQKLDSFSKGQKRIAQYILENLENAAFMKAAQIGKEVGVSESTVVRFATELGYDGYPNMQKAMRKWAFDQTRGQRRFADSEKVTEEEGFAARILRLDAERLYRTAELVDSQIFQDSVRAILDSKRVYLLGTHFASPLAEYMGNYLRFLHRDVHIVATHSQQEMLERLLFVDASDVIVVFDCLSGCELATVGSQFCKSKGATVIIISDSKLLPSIQYADYCIIAKTEKELFLEYLTAPMSIIHALLLKMIIENKTEITQSIEEFERVSAKFNKKSECKIGEI